MPLVIYLDTQDYLNFFYHGEKEGSEFRTIFGALMDRVHRGIVVVGFSFATIMEVITKPDAKNYAERARRGQLIKDICGQNAFPYVTDMAGGASFPSDRGWMLSGTETLVSADTMRAKLRDLLRERAGAQSGLPRNQRRVLRRMSLPDLARRLPADFTIAKDSLGNLPISERIFEERLFERFILGKCSDIEFEKSMNEWAHDPAEFSRIYYEHGQKNNMIDEFFKKNIEKLEGFISDMQCASARIVEYNKKVLERRRELIELGIDKVTAKAQTTQIALARLPFSEYEADLEKAVGKGRAGHFIHYMKRVVKPGFNFKRSDILDLMQMCYAYDCNLFRCDKDMANLFRDFEPFGGKLVGRLSELIDRIDNAASMSPT